MFNKHSINERKNLLITLFFARPFPRHWDFEVLKTGNDQLKRVKQIHAQIKHQAE